MLDERLLFLFCISGLLSSQAFGLDFFENSDCAGDKITVKSAVHNVQTGESDHEKYAVQACGYDCLADIGRDSVDRALDRYLRGEPMTPNTEKTRLDGQFSLRMALDQQELRQLSADYHSLRKQLLAEIQDIDDRQQILYSAIRSSKTG